MRISLAESADAFRAVDTLGIQDRESFRLSLRATLIKEAGHIPVFDELFPLFFGVAGIPPMANLVSDLSPDEADQIAEALRQLTEMARYMLQRLLRGELLSQDELERLARIVGLNQVAHLRYRDILVRRMEKALQHKDIAQAMRQLMELLADLGMDKQRVEQFQQLMYANQKALEDQLRQFAGQRIAENMSHQPPEESLDGLQNRPFSMLTDQDLQRLRKEIARLAAMLRTRVALRQKRAKAGQLDAKGTLRANLKHAGVPLQIKHREHSLKPKLVVICDISTSMRSCSELMLSLLYELQDQVSKTHAFAFIDHLEFISPDLQGAPVALAVSAVLERMPSGFYNTDLGSSLQHFHHRYLDIVDGRTTLIIVGDGRNNYNHPRAELFKNITRRCRRTLWLNPEPPALWGSGDSDMLKYAPECDQIFKVNSVADLTVVVGRLLSA